MPEDEQKLVNPPIPLHRNGFEGIPNPYTRLEATNVVSGRLSMLASLASELRGPLSTVGLASVLDTLAGDLRAAIWGDLADCQRLRGGATVTHWGTAVAEVVWPREHRQAAQLDAEDVRNAVQHAAEDHPRGCSGQDGCHALDVTWPTS